MGGWPKKRLYSRLNWLALSYPTSKAALAAEVTRFRRRRFVVHALRETRLAFLVLEFERP